MLYVTRQPARRRGTANAFALVVALTAMSSSLGLPLGVIGVIAGACVLALVGIGLSAAPLRAALAAHAVRRARYARRNARERTLVASSSGYQTLVEFTRLVDYIAAHDPELAQRSDLEALLDRFAALTVAHERALRAAEMSERVQLERIRDACRDDSSANARRLELCERRLRCLDECEAKAERFADELAIVTDTIRLTAQKASIDRQLAELDETAEAHRQLAVELNDQ